MKPITLKIQGLHSFRQMQMIQFDELCEGGVFGIFGPTGSGKSSILDAMTLALYGKVERAANNTHGILNHGEDELKVAFTFCLENADGMQTYTVERNFKRSDEWRVKSTTSRLIEEGDERVVLADKMNDVNQYINSLLGLTIDDFTRAVVLPQGKFAEFLSLKGAERRQMLQRLFNLEKYGDELLQKIKRNLTNAKHELDKILAAQAELGGATVEKVKEAEQEVKSCELLLQKREQELIHIQKEYEHKQKLWEWQKEKEENEAKLKELKEEEPEIKKHEERLSKALKAESLRPYLEECENLFLQKQTAEKQKNQRAGKLEEVNQKAALAKEEYERANKEREQREPLLLAQREKYQYAEELNKDVTTLSQTVKNARKQHEELLESGRGIKEQFQKRESLYKRGKAKQKELMEERERLSVSPSYRTKVQYAVQESRDIGSLKVQHEEKKEQHNQVKKNLQQLELEMKSSIENEEKVKKQAVEQYDLLQHIYNLVCEREREIERFIASGEHEIEAMQRKVEEVNKQKLALTLSAHLHDGKPCPVCGSTTHPLPATGEGIEETDGKEIDLLRKNLSLLQERKYICSSLKLKLEPLAEKLLDCFGDFEQTEQEDITPLLTKDETLKDCIVKLQTELKGLEQDYIGQKEKIDRLVKIAGDVSEKKNKLLFEFEQQNKMLMEQAKFVQQVEQEMNKAQTEWQERYKEFEITSISSIQQQLERNDQKMAELNQRIEKSVEYLEETEKALEKLREEWNVHERKEVELSSFLQNKKASLLEQQQRLTQIIGENLLDELLNGINKELHSLKEREEETLKRWHLLNNEHQEVKASYELIVSSLAELNERYEEKERKWKDKRNSSGFHSDIDVKEMFITEEQQQKIREEVEAFWDKLKSVTIALEHVTKLLDNQSVTEQSFKETSSILADLKGSVKEATTELGSARALLKDLQVRNERLGSLEKEREKIQEELSQYQKLQSVFKGNAFIEYMAQEQLIAISRDASERLGFLTRQRYALEVDSQGGFVIRDDANGGVKRPISSLSGGETFLTSLSLALSLSAGIQLRGEYPLQFFFLDEGFGTLDSELLDTVITALEKLQSNDLSIGIISHVQELRARLPKRLIVEKADDLGNGTKVKIETL